jgi:hypothetical protein
MQALKPLINLKNRTGNSLNDIDPEITIGDSLVATWDVSDCIVPDSMEVILTAFTTVEGSEYNHFLAPVIRTVPITKDEGEAPYDDTDVIRPPHPPVHPIFNDSIVVLKSYAFTDKSRPDELNFMVITLQECEIRFVARVFSKGPRNELRNEKHTGWSTKNAVSMSKHDINPYGASDTIVQLAAEVRAAPNHPITTVLIGEKNLQL